MIKKIKVGIVGLGRLGRLHASNIAFNIPNAELIAVCSIIPEEVESVSKEWGIPFVYSDFSEMIKNKELDAVAILSPSPFHTEHINMALNAGLHVFVDKPLGINVEECRLSEKVVADHPNQIFMIGFMRRYDPSYRYAKQLIDQGKIGKPFLIKLTSCDPEHTIEGAIRFGANSGGLFIDMTVHDIDLARWFLQDEAEEVYAIGGSFVHKEFEGYNDADNTLALMRFKNGGIAMFHSGRNAAHGYQVETEIIGPLGSLRIAAEPRKNLCTIFDQNGIVNECSQSFQERFSEAYLEEMKEFIRCIITGEQPGITVHDGTMNTQVAFAATQAFHEKRIVKL